MTRLYLIGFMGAGKSTVGNEIAGRLGVPFIDLDDEIESRASQAVKEIFSTRGEEHFRALEREALLAVTAIERAVVACGGGVVLRDDNRVTLKSTGTVVYLKVSAGEAIARIGDADTRPLLSGAGGGLAATALLASREALYKAVADIEVETLGRTASEVATAVITDLEERGMW